MTPEQPAPLANALEFAWGIIANVSGSDWSLQSPEWQEAAARFRDQYWNPVASGTEAGRSGIASGESGVSLPLPAGTPAPLAEFEGLVLAILGAERDVQRVDGFNAGEVRLVRVNRSNAIGALRSFVAGLVKDGERLDWLQSTPTSAIRPAFPDGTRSVAFHEGCGSSQLSVRGAIDSAIWYQSRKEAP